MPDYFDEFSKHLISDDKPSGYFRKIEDEDFSIMITLYAAQQVKAYRAEPQMASRG